MAFSSFKKVVRFCSIGLLRTGAEKALYAAYDSLKLVLKDMVNPKLR